jgi:DNA-binding transcriptional LysR family regulator
VDLHQLRTFVAAAQERHLTRAAERLHISQPTASAHIRALEESLQVTLFHRKSHGLETTPAGELLQRKAQEVLDGALELRALARSLTQAVAGRVVIGCNADPFTSRIGRLAHELAQSHPLLELSVEMRSTLAIIGGLRNGELDAGFFLAMRPEEGLESIRLRSFEFAVAGPASWQDRLAAASLHALARMPWIVSPAGNTHTAMLHSLFEQVGFSPQGIVESNNDHVTRAMVTEGVGLALVRTDVAERGPAAGARATAPGLRTRADLYFAYRDVRSADPVLHAVHEQVQAIWRTDARQST